LQHTSSFYASRNDEEIHIKFEQELVALLISIDESYPCCVTYEQGKKIIYVLLNKTLYGTSLLFWMKLSAFLVWINTGLSRILMIIVL
jgi:hypothetical protein